jgi:hypothetical protein
VIAAALVEQGVEPPEDLLPVAVWPAAWPYRRAFLVLSAARGSGMNGPQPIAYGEMLAYARANGFAGTPAELEEFVDLIQAQDKRLLELAAPKPAPATGPHA